MADAAGQEGWKFKPLFFPKKVSRGVDNMLKQPDISPVSFHMWWRSANQSRDFWVETETEMIRVHVVPRKETFNPGFWTTSLSELKDKLLNILGNKHKTDVIPFYADGLQHVLMKDDWRNVDVKVKPFEHGNSLWIGRSRFNKRCSSYRDCPDACDVPRFAVPMAHDAGGAVGGTRLAGHSGAPQMVSARVEADPHRASPTSSGGTGRKEAGGSGPHVACWTQGEVRGEPHLVAGKGDSGLDAEAAARSAAAGRRPSHDLRALQVMDVQGGAQGVCRVGRPGDGGESQLLGGLGPIRQLGKAGLGEEGSLRQSEGSSGDQGRSGGEGDDGGPCRRVVVDMQHVEQGDLSSELDTFQEGKQRIRGGDGGGTLGGSSGRAAGLGDANGSDEAEVQAEGVCAAASTGVTVGDAAVGLSTEKYNKEVGCGTLQNDEEIGLSTADQEKVFEYKATVGRCMNNSKLPRAKTNGDYEIGEDDALVEPYGTGERDTGPGGGSWGWRAYGARKLEEWTGSLSGAEMEGLSPRQKAKKGIRQRKINCSTKKKLYHMGNKLCQVLLTCAAAAWPRRWLSNLCRIYGWLRAGNRAPQVHCLEVFAGEAEISSAFARRGLGVLRPRDLKYGDDLHSAATRHEILEEIRSSRPMVVWLAPPCTHWCAFSRLNFTKQERRRRRQRDKDFLEFIDEVMLLQRLLGGHVVVENPATSDIWLHPILARWLKDEKVFEFVLHMCAYGLKSRVDEGFYLKKSVKLMTTHSSFQKHLGLRCQASHEHRPVQGQDTRWSAVYPRMFAEAVVDAVVHVGQNYVFMAADEDQVMEDAEREKASGSAMVPLGFGAENRGAEDITFKGSVNSRVAGALRRMHQNLGHPTNRELVRHLTLGGASKDLVAAAHNLKCQTCLKCVRPQAHRVVKPAALLDFGDAVALDIIFLDTVESKGNLALNMVDVASSYQVVVPLENRHADVVADTFYKHWVSWAGVPFKLVLDLDTGFQDSFWKITGGDGIAMRCAAGQAHWQNGVAERFGGAWKQVWDKLCVDHNVTDKDIADATAAVNEARNTLRNRSGYSPRQWVFGSNGRLVPDPEEVDGNLASLNNVTADEKMARKQTLRVGAKMAFFHSHTVDAVRKSLVHKTRVMPKEYKPGDMVYVYRESKSKGKRASAQWLGPATVIGPEGSNYWVTRGGRCLLAAREHLRPAEHEEVSEALRVKAALLEVKKAMDNEFEEAADDLGPLELEAGGDMEFQALLDEAVVGDVPMEEAPLSAERKKLERALEAGKQFERLAKQNRLLDDVPVSVKKHLKVHDNRGDGGRTGEEQQPTAVNTHFYTKKIKSPEALEKALEKEIPWNLIPFEEKELFKDAEQKQWDEHIQFGAVRPLSREESLAVEEEVGKERILTSRFLYRDKNLAKRRRDGSIPCKAKARLCVGGQKDPDLGVVEMAVDAPTANRHSILLALMVALSRAWEVAIGDIRAAFLNGVEAPRRLYFRQPVRGIPGLEPGQLIEIVKGVFGLATSPKLWWLKLSADLLGLEIFWEGEKFHLQQNVVDPCLFMLQGQDSTVRGAILTHVDDLMVMAEPGLQQALKDAIAAKFPVDDWEQGSFEYVGCEYQFSAEGVTVTQSGYAQSRLEKVKAESHLQDQDPAPQDMLEQNRTAIGCLSWLAKQTRPDLQFMVAQAQKVQANPTVKDVKETNKIVDAAKKFDSDGIKLKKIPENDMVILAYHDAAWANVELEATAGAHEPQWDGESKLASQLASLVMIADQKVLQNKPGNASVVDWRSKASSRVCRSTFAGETMACGEALETAL